MAFRTLFLAHAPDADKEKHKSFIDTGKYQLDLVIVKDQAGALIEEGEDGRTAMVLQRM